jgi:hypothetical protein
MSIVHLPTCPRCKSMMRQVRVCVRETTRYRVFECLRCYADLMWAPELRRNEDVAVERGGSSKVVPMISPTRPALQAVMGPPTNVTTVRYG